MDPSSRDGSRGPQELLGRRLAGIFALEEHLGQDAFGPLYRGRHLEANMSVAVSFFDVHDWIEEEQMARFLPLFREGVNEVAQKVRTDPQFARSIGTGSTVMRGKTLVYTVRELVEAESLSAYLIRREANEAPGTTLDEALAALRPVMESMAYAHELGLHHGDLSADSVLVSRLGGKPSFRITDFGIRQLARDLCATFTPGVPLGRLSGSPYLGPEQRTGGGASARSDVHALALLLVTWMHGVFPEEHTLYAILASLDARQSNALARALAPVPTERFTNAAELWDMLLTETRRSLPGRRPGGWAPQLRDVPLAPAGILPSERPPHPGAPPRELMAGETYVEVVPPDHVLEAIALARAARPAPALVYDTDPAPPPPPSLPAAPPPPRDGGQLLTKRQALVVITVAMAFMILAFIVAIVAIIISARR